MNTKLKKRACRGDIFLVDLGPIRAADRHGVLPVLILQSDAGDHGELIIAADIKRRITRKSRDSHVRLKGADCGLFRSSVVLPERIRILSGKQLGEFMGSVGEDKMREVDAALSVSIGIWNSDT